MKKLIVTAVEMLEPVIIALMFMTVIAAAAFTVYWIMSGPLGPVFTAFGWRVLNWSLDSTQGNVITVVCCLSGGVGIFSFLLALNKNNR